MSALLNDLLAQAAQLSLDERGQLAAALLATLDEDDPDEAELDPAAIEAAWRVEIDTRVAQIRAGVARLIPGDEVMRRARQ